MPPRPSTPTNDHWSTKGDRRPCNAWSYCTPSKTDIKISNASVGNTVSQPPASTGSRPRSPCSSATRTGPATGRLVAQADPQDLNTTIWLAKVLNTVGRPEDAGKALRALAEAHPDEVGPWLALLYFQAGRNKPPKRDEPPTGCAPP